MKIIKLIYRFLGGIQFAIVLIASLAVTVVIGTFIESKTDSHLFAARFTYSNPLFRTLLFGFFINILFATLRRWPFKIRHIPFIITHIGLLMILGGTIIKSYFGVQGSMSISEGSGSDRIFLADTYVLQAEKRHPINQHILMRDHYVFNQNFFGELSFDEENGLLKPFPELSIKLLESYPNSYEKIETWIKGSQGFIEGFPPFKVYEIEAFESSEKLPISSQIHFSHSSNRQWNIMAFRTDHIKDIAERVYLQDLTVHIKDTRTGKSILQAKLNKGIKEQLKWDGGSAHLNLQLDFSRVTGLDLPFLKVYYSINGQKQTEQVDIALNGPKSLLNENKLTSYLGSSSFTIDLEREPVFLFIQDLQGDIHFFAFNEFGEIHAQSFRNDNLESYVVYDQGYGGYFTQVKVPSESQSRREKEFNVLHQIAYKMKEALKQDPSLSLPLLMLQEACQKAHVDFVNTFLAYLYLWDKSHSWHYNENLSLPSPMLEVFSYLDLNSLSIEEKKGCFWNCILFSAIENHLLQGKNLIDYLKKEHWPLIDELLKAKDSMLSNSEQIEEILSTLGAQVFSIASDLPDIEKFDFTNIKPEKKALLFSAYLRAHNIHYRNFIQTITPKLDAEFIVVESPITFIRKPIKPLNKLEDNLPSVVLELRSDEIKEKVAFTYDKFGTGLKLPVLNGKYLMRFQPRFIHIPYRIRLRDARQINYANSTQPYSFESDLLISDKRSGTSIETTISMNHVYETWDGYRFYLANISPPLENSVQRIQLVINYDPAKYFLTYPGAIILSLGILLLFWMRPYAKK